MSIRRLKGEIGLELMVIMAGVIVGLLVLAVTCHADVRVVEAITYVVLGI